MTRLQKKLVNLCSYSLLVLLALFQVYCGKTGAVSQTACGFKQNSLGQRISLKSNLPLKMYFDSQFPTQYRQAVQNAMTTWNKSLGRVVFVIDGEIANTKPQHDSLNVIYWENTWDQSSSTTQEQQANTVFYWADNEIIEADIIINGQNFTYSVQDTTPSSAVDVESLALHELGHALGLVHITSQPSVMAPDLLNGQVRRQLQPIDTADIHCEY